MATWMVHLRIADYFINKFDMIDHSEFAAGSVAPDCGYGEKDSFGEFTPPPSVTHWSPTGRKCDCRYKDFFDIYLKNKPNDKAFSFFLGYYIHLITDIMWSSRMYQPTLNRYKDEYSKNPEFLKVIKVDWYDLDHKFLREHPNFYPFRLLKRKRYVRDYLPYYEKNQLTTQTRFIVDFYDENMNKENLYRKYLYLNEEQMNNFIECACCLIELDLTKKFPLKFSPLAHSQIDMLTNEISYAAYH